MAAKFSPELQRVMDEALQRLVAWDEKWNARGIAAMREEQRIAATWANGYDRKAKER